MTILLPIYVSAEKEFKRKHPDIFATWIASRIVKLLSEQTTNIRSLRSDISVQAGAIAPEHYDDPVPIYLHVTGQISSENTLPIEQIIEQAGSEIMKEAGMLDVSYGPNDLRFTDQQMEIIAKVNAQSGNLGNKTSKNLWGDGIILHGHYLGGSYGIGGRPAALVLAEQIDDKIDELLKEGAIDGLRPEGKVHVELYHTGTEFTIERINIAVAHAEGKLDTVKEGIKYHITEFLSSYNVKEDSVHVNLGGEFDEWWLPTDSGTSGKKDHVHFYGGIAELGLGTEGIFGKGAHKASSVALPYVLQISYEIGKATEAKYIRCSILSCCGEEKLHRLAIEGIGKDGRSINEIIDISHVINQLPKDVQGVREFTGMPVTQESYAHFNDPSGFFATHKPWMKKKQELRSLVGEIYAG